jgi:hemerythrin-like domain-containing protein
MKTEDRRAFLLFAGAGTLLASCTSESQIRRETVPSGSPSPKPAQNKAEDEEKEVSATEDLMREHGVIRRALVVYREAAAGLRSKPAAVPTAELQKAAQLLRAFGEDYHEKQLEEAHIFPPVKKAGGPAAKEIDTLLAQHQRGREITDYVLAVTTKPLASNAAEPLARTLESFARMYEEHAAREDTIVFQAWKELLSEKDLDEMGELFEKIERTTFGKDGFEDAVRKIGEIELAMGLDSAALTAPPPPKLA